MSKQDVVEAVKNSLKELEDNQIKLLDGHYKVNEYFVKTWKVDGNNFNMRDPHDAIDFKARIEYGDFGKIYNSMHSFHEILKVLHQRKLKTWLDQVLFYIFKLPQSPEFF